MKQEVIGYEPKFVLSVIAGVAVGLLTQSIVLAFAAGGATYCWLQGDQVLRLPNKNRQ